MTAVSGRGKAPEYSDVEYVFEPHGSTQIPLHEYLRDLWERRRFVQALADAELKGSRNNTVIGELWSVLDPLIQGAVYWFVFTIIRGRGDSREQVLIGLARQQITVAQRVLAELGQQRIAAVVGGDREARRMDRLRARSRGRDVVNGNFTTG